MSDKVIIQTSGRFLVLTKYTSPGEMSMNEGVSDYGNMWKKQQVSSAGLAVAEKSSESSARERDLLTKNISINNVTPPRPQRENSPLTSLEAL